jgi:REP element-mobilizing transposase RayT
MKGLRTYYRRHLPHYQPEGETYHVVFRLAGSLPSRVVEELRVEREQAEKRIEKAENERNRTRLLRECRWAHFERFEKLLAGNSRGPFWLRKPEIAEIVNEAIHYRDQKEYDLIAHAIMPNHVHMVFEHISRRDTDEGTSIVRRAECAASTVTDNAHVRRRDLKEGSGNVCRAECAGGMVTDNTHVRRRDLKEGSGNVCRADRAGGMVTDNVHVRRRDSSTYTVTDILENLKWYTALNANRRLGRKGAFWQHESYDHVIRDAAELDRTIEYVLMNPVKAGFCKDWRDWKWSYVKEGYAGD